MFNIRRIILLFSAQGFTILAVLASIMYAGHSQESTQTLSRTSRTA